MDFNQQDLKSKAIKGFIWRFGERISSQLVSFIVSIVLARLLLPKEYGVVAITMIFINIANVLAVSGLGTSLVQKKNADEIDFSTMLYAGIALSCILYLILFITAPWIADLYHNDLVCPILRVMGLLLPISAINSIQQASVSRKLDFKKFFYATFVGTFCSGIVGIVMAYNGYGVWSLVGQQLSNNLINTITLNRIITWRPKLLFSFDRFKHLFGFGSKLMGANLLGTFFNELRGLIIGVKYTPADLAFYNRGDQFPSLFANNINNSINAVLFPAIAQVQDDKAAVKRAIRRSMMTSSYVMSPILITLAVVADKVVIILLTEKWMPAVPFVQALSIGYLFSIYGMTNLQALNAVGRSDITLRLEFFKKPLYIAILLITMWVSPLAMAIGNAVYSFIATILNCWPNKSIIGYKMSEQIFDVLPSLGLSVLCGIVMFLLGMLPINVYSVLAIQIIVGMSMYIYLSYILHLESFEYAKETILKFKNKNNE